MTKNTSTFTELNLAKIMLKGIFLWGEMKDMKYYYK